MPENLVKHPYVLMMMSPPSNGFIKPSKGFAKIIEKKSQKKVMKMLEIL
jgi:hypothetical protein